MRAALMTATHEAHIDLFEREERDQAARAGSDSWLVVIRAFFFLVAGMLLISLFTTV
jgi:hypothetical protein